jgi:hypothetical protein
MAKLQKREIIILGVMGAAILFAAFNFVMPARKLAPGESTARAMEDSNDFLNQVRGKMAPVVTDIRSNILFAKAKDEWKPNPFLDGVSYRKWVQAQIVAKAAPSVPKTVEFTFTGYLETQSHRMAIVNGIEYREGDIMEPGGYVLHSATPVKITIVNKATGAKETVLLQEEGGVNEPKK